MATEENPGKITQDYELSEKVDDGVLERNLASDAENDYSDKLKDDQELTSDFY
ncbi:hypothetical protein AALP_AA3G300800 [Arabis alpina]|uniref:Uncharacterized protein n=1 Tax=Arabis alpina TaxID=50452 RepID=A0A087HCM9_ARAAL|nr:hypothetical protein AALP_AA3G300800 [Arabis alpina]